MWSPSVSELFDGAFSNVQTYALLLIVPTLLLISVAPAHCAQDYSLYRMQQYEISGVVVGAAGHAANVETVLIDPADSSPNYFRRCGIVRWDVLRVMDLSELVASGLSGLVVLVPPDWHSVARADIEEFQRLELSLINSELRIPVFFSALSERWHSLLRELRDASSQMKASASADIVDFIFSDRFYIHGTQQTGKASAAEQRVVNIVTKVRPRSDEADRPIVLIVAHHDAYGVAPGLASSSNAAASAIAGSVEMMRIVRDLLASDTQLQRFEFWFLLSGHGFFNFLGTKKWLDAIATGAEQQRGGADGVTFTDRLKYVVCLEAIGGGDGGQLYLHVSRPPKNSTRMGRLVQRLTSEAGASLVHRKINLGDDELAWEHERFSLHKVPAMTASSFTSPDVSVRRSITDDRVDTDELARNVGHLTSALLREVYGAEADLVGNQVSQAHLSSVVDGLAAQQRAVQQVGGGAAGNRYVDSLERLCRRYGEVKIERYASDASAGDTQHFTPTSHSITIIKSKHMAFDIILAVVIAGSLFALHMALEYGRVMELTRAISSFLMIPLLAMKCGASGGANENGGSSNSWSTSSTAMRGGRGRRP